MNNLELEKAKTQQLNVVLAYLLWWFVGIFGMHRLYTKQKKWWIYIVLGLIGLITTVIFIGYIILIGLFILWIIDGFKLSSVVKDFNLDILEKFERDFK
ncbi:TM2 domain-containing protein [Poseidonibacter lekithochrous]|uniref:TM2 domain-containing protein n=1 Tax=Poseidonibacter TaxID=2321187 RepID=UPI001C09F8FD|nr:MULTISPECIES: TM2 domain-containing protein [Poseidonibacter]MBU3015178.1 TM2 domain-containing protein [Poseidonibacter lekithochrous]MDO6828475.1 TM2 domain-containing protein [Poseidonibacter sp. 1_MG-2023]